MGRAPPSGAELRGAWGGGNKKPYCPCVRGDTRRCSGHPLTCPTVADGRSARSGVPLVSGSSAPQAFGPATPGTRPPRPLSPMMMVQALTSPISFLSATRSEAPGPGPGPGEGEGAGPGFPRPLGCCVWPAMSLSRRVPAPCAAQSVRPAAGPSVRPSVGALARLRSPDSAHRRAHALARGPGAGPPGCGGQGGAEGGPAGRPPPPPSLKGTAPTPAAWGGRRGLGADLGRTF